MSTFDTAAPVRSVHTAARSAHAGAAVVKFIEGLTHHFRSHLAHQEESARRLLPIWGVQEVRGTGGQDFYGCLFGFEITDDRRSSMTYAEAVVERDRLRTKHAKQIKYTGKCWDDYLNW